MVAHPAAEEFVHRYAQRLAPDVPQGHVHGGDGGAEYPVGGEESAAEHHLPQVLDAPRVLTGDQLGQMGEPARDRLLPGSDADFAQAVDAFVGVDHHEHHAVAVVGKSQHFQARDLHATPR